MAIVAYFGFLRFNELQNIKRKDIAIAIDHVAISIPKSKTDPYKKGSTTIISAGSTSHCPRKILMDYLGTIGLFLDKDSNRFIFQNLTSLNGSYSLSHGNVPITYGRAREELLFHLRLLGIETKPYGWHSFRRGGCTRAANKGISERLLKKHGRWVTDISKDKYIMEDLVSRISVTQNLLF